MDMTTKSGGMGGMGDMSEKKVHMWMYFHTTIADLCLFDFWKITTVGEMIYSCFIIMAAGIVLELLKFVRFWAEQRHKVMEQRRQLLQPGTTVTKYATLALVDKTTYRQRLLAPSHLLQTGLFAVQLVLSYLLMLVFMTFSVWLCLAVCTGLAIGYYLFGARELGSVTPQQQTASDH